MPPRQLTLMPLRHYAYYAFATLIIAFAYWLLIFFLSLRRRDAEHIFDYITLLSLALLYLSYWLFIITLKAAFITLSLRHLYHEGCIFILFIAA